MTLVKRLSAIHKDAYGNYHRTKIAEGNTADFAKAIGFIIEDSDEYTSTNEQTGKSYGHAESLGVNGVWPTMQSKAFSNLEGKLLTLCDMTFTNKEQREAFKSVVKDTLWTHFESETNFTENTYDWSEPNYNVQWKPQENKISES